MSETPGEEVVRARFLQVAVRWGRAWFLLMMLIVGQAAWRTTHTVLSRAVWLAIGEGVLLVGFVPVGVRLERLVAAVARDAEERKKRRPLEKELRELASQIAELEKAKDHLDAQVATKHKWLHELDVQLAAEDEDFRRKLLALFERLGGS